jgi:ABC-type branched-subunit amino acid transport system ATPase component
MVATYGTGLLVVEHDIALVRELCSSLYVLDFGKLIASGPAREVLGSEIVRAAYLGSEAVEEALS